MMTLIRKKRRSSNPETFKHLDKKFQDVLGRKPDAIEIKLFPVLIQSLLNRSLDDSIFTKRELEFIKEYESKGLLGIEGDLIGCTEEFWNFISEVSYDRFICEVEWA